MAEDTKLTVCHVGAGSPPVATPAVQGGCPQLVDAVILKSVVTRVLNGAVVLLQFGQVNNVIIPRPTAPGTPAPSGLGKVIVEFGDDAGCTAAYRVLNGRRFGGRTVVATYLPEQSYVAGQFDV